jgi:hypothetical protein
MHAHTNTPHARRCISDCLLKHDMTSLSFVARAVMNLQSMYGKIAHIRAKGDLSNAVINLVTQMEKQARSYPQEQAVVA